MEMDDNKAHNALLDIISRWPDWKIDALMLDDSDLKIKKTIDDYRKRRVGNSERTSLQGKTHKLDGTSERGMVG